MLSDRQAEHEEGGDLLGRYLAPPGGGLGNYKYRKLGGGGANAVHVTLLVN